MRQVLLWVFLALLLTACASNPPVLVEDSAAVVNERGEQAGGGKTVEQEKSVLIEDLSVLHGGVVVDERNRHTTYGERTHTISTQEIEDEREDLGLSKVNIDTAETGSRGTPPKVRGKASRVNDGNSASRALLNQSEKSLAQGDLRLAATSAERALRVSPGNPHAYYQLAKIYQQQNNHAQAIHFIEKAISQGNASSALERDLWLLKADSYRALGDRVSEQAALNKARN